MQAVVLWVQFARKIAVRKPFCACLISPLGIQFYVLGAVYEYVRTSREPCLQQYAFRTTIRGSVVLQQVRDSCYISVVHTVGFRRRTRTRGIPSYHVCSFYITRRLYSYV